MWNVLGNKSNNQELIHAQQNENQDNVKWRSPSIPSDNVSELFGQRVRKTYK